jgi:PPOX class probable F420-dependent enzyme
MLDFSTTIGKKILRRLDQEQIIWLTTVDARNTPQPRPVWFHWDGETVLIFSQPEGAKLRHIARNPRVALNFNSSPDGDEVGVLIGEARISQEPLSQERIAAYMKKYAEGIKGLGLTAESMATAYSATVQVTPYSLRGF